MLSRFDHKHISPITTCDFPGCGGGVRTSSPPPMRSSIDDKMYHFCAIELIYKGYSFFENEYDIHCIQ